MENSRQYTTGINNYAAALSSYTDHLESLLDEQKQRHPGTLGDFRATRPSNPEGLLGQPDAMLDRDPDFVMGGDDNDQDSDDGHLKDPTAMAISIPPQGLQVCWGIFLTIHQCSTMYTFYKD